MKIRLTENVLHYQPVFKIPALRVYLTNQFLTGILFWLFFCVNTLFFIRNARLDALQLVLVGTALEAGIFLFEIPTGMVADLYSRRFSVVIGTAVIGLGTLLTGMVANFYLILAGQVLWGIGFTFTSGALDAWISDEAGANNAPTAYLRGSQFYNLGAVAGIGLCTVISFAGLNIPILASGFGMLLFAVILALTMPEENYKPAPVEDRHTWDHFFATFRKTFDLTRSRKVLLIILAVGLVFGLYSEGFDRLWIASLLERFTLPEISWLPVTGWVGLVYAASMLTGAVAARITEKRLDLTRTDHFETGLLAATLLIALALAGFTLTPWRLLACVLYCVIAGLRTVTNSLYTAWANTQAEPDVRATVLSTISQADAIGQLLGGPVSGMVAKGAGLQAGLLLSSILLIPNMLLLSVRLIQRKKL
jgi:DHA3 family tetracycline resistance protein-like MFS transporter